MWIYLALAGFLVGAFVNILDKFILTSKKVAPSVFVFYSSIFLLPVLVVAILFRSLTNNAEYLPVIFLASLGFMGGLFTMYRAEQFSEVSHVAPLIGALSPLAIIFLSSIFLNEVQTNLQILGIIFLVIGSLIISFEVSRERFGWHLGMLWAILAAFCFAVFHVFSKFAYNAVGFTPGLLWIWGSMSVYAVLLLLVRPMRQAVFGFRSAVVSSPGPESKTNKAAWVFLNKFLGLVSLLLVQYAVSLGSVSIVNALAGVQYAFLIVLVALLSKYRPKIFAESYGRGEKIQEFIAIIFIIIGLAILLY